MVPAVPVDYLRLRESLSLITQEAWLVFQPISGSSPFQLPQHDRLSTSQAAPRAEQSSIQRWRQNPGPDTTIFILNDRKRFRPAIWPKKCGSMAPLVTLSDHVRTDPCDDELPAAPSTILLLSKGFKTLSSGQTSVSIQVECRGFRLSGHSTSNTPLVS